MIRIPVRRLLIVSLIGLLLLLPAESRAQAEPVVRAVLYYSPTCPHCHQVINEVLIPMVEEHETRLQIVAIDVSQPGGQMLYQSAVEHFEIPEERLGVPALVVGDIVLVGSVEIPEQFPGIVREGLATGIDWPAIPGFVPPAEAAEPTAQAEVMATQPSAAVATATSASAAAPTVSQASDETLPAPEIEPTTAPIEGDEAPSMLDSSKPEIAFDDAEDPPADTLGFALASVVLIAMVIAFAYVAWRLIALFVGERSVGRILIGNDLSWAIPIIAIVGIGVAAYLAYVEVNEVAAVCGPVGHCNLVQSSSYASILGVPIALLGLASYLAIVILWAVERLVKRDAWKMAARFGLIGLTIFGTLFSIYLTLLELFVIRAVCAWCLTSAVIMTLLMVLVVRSATEKPDLALG